jgi:SAM-dependent methyltransferase
VTPRVHRSAAIGFERAADDYERGRPGYPDAALARLSTELGLRPGRVVLDLAAGTGKLTRAVAITGAELIAVEPVAAMRRALQASLPSVRALEGTAEAIPLPEASVDAVLVAQAFHWFDAAVAAAEIHRVLRPAGGLGVIWNSWDESVAWVARVQALIHSYVGAAPQQRSSRWDAELSATGLFGPIERAEFPHVVIAGVDVLRARVASVSYISALPDAERERVLDEVIAIAAEDPSAHGREQFETPYTTTVTWCRALPAPPAPEMAPTSPRR